MASGGAPPIFLIGFMATGKTTVGRLVAQRMGFAFVDLDEVIAGAAGAPVAEIFRQEGEDGFRRRESQAIQAACALTGTLVATGGGAACREGNLEAMLKAGQVVALSATPEEILRRAGGGAGRPLLDGAANRDLMTRQLLRQREPFYERAHHRVETAGRTPDEAADEIMRLLGAPA